MASFIFEWLDSERNREWKGYGLEIKIKRWKLIIGLLKLEKTYP